MDEFDLTEVNGIKKLYHATYFSVATQLVERGMAESDIKVKYRQAVIYFCAQQKQHNFDHDLDIVLYLLTLCLLE